MPASSRPSNNEFYLSSTVDAASGVAGFHPAQSQTRGMDAQDDGACSTLSADYTTAKQRA